MMADTMVVFRKYPQTGEVIALFPTITEGKKGVVLSYMHAGQHAPAQYVGVIKDTVQATAQEYSTLFRELTWYGYSLRPVMRFDKPDYMLKPNQI